jgi:hypothetical protein
LENADLPTDETREPDENVTAERRVHPQKQYWQSVSTDEGMQIDPSDEQPSNARSPMNKSPEPESNVTVSRDMQ